MNVEMKKEEFLAKLDELLELPDATLKGTEALKDLEAWDSLAVLSFIALVDEHCGITVAPKDIAACKTVNDLVALTGDKVSG
jgi:acyl carrier protein